MSGHNAIDFYARVISDLDAQILTCRAELREPPRDPNKLKRLLALLEKRNRALRNAQSFRS